MQCNHVVACAIDETRVALAVDMFRSGNPSLASIAMAMLSGPCITGGSE